MLADANPDRIKGFLERFHGEKDVASGLADLDLNEHQDVPRLQVLKYMNQLVSNMRFHSNKGAHSYLQQKIANREQQMLTIDLEDIYKACFMSTWTASLLTSL